MTCSRLIASSLASLQCQPDCALASESHSNENGQVPDEPKSGKAMSHPLRAEDLDVNLRLVEKHPVVCNDRVVLVASVSRHEHEWTLGANAV